MAIVRKNILYLAFVQIVNYVFPLFTFPYLIRILGGGNFGILAFCQATTIYLILLVDYGFNFSATRKIAICRSNKAEMSEIFFDTMAAKLILLILSFIFLLIIFSANDKLYAVWPIMLGCFIGVIGNAMFPIWFFQGIERMELLVIISSIVKTGFLFLIFIIIRNKDDLVYAAILQNGGQLVSAFIAFYIIKKHQLVNWFKPSWRGAIETLKGGWPLFVSNISISFYTTFNVILLGFLGSNIQVGLYASADRMRQVSQGAMSPVSQAIFPRLSMYAENNNHIGSNNLFNKGFALLLAMGLVFSFIFLFLSDTIIAWYLGNDYIIVAKYLKEMALLPIIIACSIAWGQWKLMAQGHSGVLGRIYFFAALLHVLYTWIFVKYFWVSGLIAAVTLTEAMIILSMYIACRYYKLK